MPNIVGIKKFNTVFLQRFSYSQHGSTLVCYLLHTTEVVGSNLSSCYYYSLIGCVRDKGIVPIRICSDTWWIYSWGIVAIGCYGVSLLGVIVPSRGCAVDISDILMLVLWSTSGWLSESGLYEDSRRTTLQEQSKEYSLEEYPQVKAQVFEAVHESCPKNLQELEKLYNVMCKNWCLKYWPKKVAKKMYSTRSANKKNYSDRIKADNANKPGSQIIK